MIPASHQLKPASKRTERRILKDQSDEKIKAIHARGAELMPAEYLVRHQTDEERGFKIRAQAIQRNAKRNAKRLKNSQK